MSMRGSRPKIASESVMSPAVSPPRVVTFSSMSPALFVLGIIRGCRGLTVRRRFRKTEFAGLRRFLRQRLFDGVAHGDPAAFRPRHRALHENEAALCVRLHHLEIE